MPQSQPPVHGPGGGFPPPPAVPERFGDKPTPQKEEPKKDDMPALAPKKETSLAEAIELMFTARGIE